MTLSRNKKRIREQRKDDKRDHVLRMRSHTKRRCEERLGFVLSRFDRKEIIENIKHFPVVEGDPDKSHIRYGFFREQEILLAYDGQANEIKTILPLDHKLIEDARTIYVLRHLNKSKSSRYKPRSIGTVEPEDQK
jgi:hypothetical protein